jgi:hypothetical protein
MARFDGVVLTPNPPQASRYSTRAAKVNSKKDVSELFQRLGQEFQAVTKTLEEIAGALE